MLKDIQRFWPKVACCWSFVFLAIIGTLYEDLFGFAPHQGIVIVLMLVALIIMMGAVVDLRAKIGFGRTFVVWIVPAMTIWAIFLVIRGIAFAIMGREM
nr:putative integron gene cassette protein [uncultured bacterium]